MTTTITSECENHNSFTKNGKLDSISNLVARTRHDGTLYLNPDNIDSLGAILKKLGVQNGSTFQNLDTFESIIDTLEYFVRFQQYYNSILVSGGGYTLTINRPVEPCLDVPKMVKPYIKTGISVSTIPDVSSLEALEILDLDGFLVLDTQLVISHNILHQCEYTLTWKVTYQKGTTKVSWIDAHNEDILKTIVMSDNEIDAPTSTYGPRNLNDRDLGSSRTLQTPDQKISVYEFNPDSPLNKSQWASNLIPSSTSDVEWTTESLPEVYQAFFVTNLAIPIFETFGDSWANVHIACDVPNGTHSFIGSRIKDAYIEIGRIGGGTTALYDAIGHELGHTFINQFFTTESESINNRSLHEALADIIGTYVEYKLHALDYIMGDDESEVAEELDRDLQNPGSNYDCFTEVMNLNSPYNRGRPLGYWFYLISEGGSHIEALGIDLAFEILINSLPELNPDENDYPDLMEATLLEVEKRFGICSDEFLSVARAWELICVDTGFPKAAGLVSGCSYLITGPSEICEEWGGAEFCAEGGLENYNYRFTIIGKNSTGFTSQCGMQGNSQQVNGCDCLTLVSIPNFPYYPQSITIEVYSSQAGSKYIARKKVLIKDCDGDDPTCRDYYNLDPFQVNDLESANLTQFSNTLLHAGIESTSKDSLVMTNRLDGYNSVGVFDIFGRTLFQGRDLETFNKCNYQGLLIIVYFNESGQIVKVMKTFLMN